MTVGGFEATVEKPKLYHLSMRDKAVLEQGLTVP
jgi:hypothetical protein